MLAHVLQLCCSLTVSSDAAASTSMISFLVVCLLSSDIMKSEQQTLLPFGKKILRQEEDERGRKGKKGE